MKLADAIAVVVDDRMPPDSAAFVEIEMLREEPPDVWFDKDSAHVSWLTVGRVKVVPVPA